MKKSTNNLKRMTEILQAKQEAEAKLTIYTSLYKTAALASVLSVISWTVYFFGQNYLDNIFSIILFIPALTIALDIYHKINAGIKYAFKISGLIGGIVMLVPIYPDSIIYGLYIWIVTFLVILTLPLFALKYKNNEITMQLKYINFLIEHRAEENTLDIK